MPLRLFINGIVRSDRVSPVAPQGGKRDVVRLLAREEVLEDVERLLRDVLRTARSASAATASRRGNVWVITGTIISVVI